MAENDQTQSVLDLATDVTQILHLARITETAERFEDMCALMGKLVQSKSEAKEDLAVEERNMLSVAYKNVVGQRRASWRSLDNEIKQGNANNNLEMLKEYKKVVETELKMKCGEVLNLLDKYLLLGEAARQELKDSDVENKEDKVETQVFYLKMSGDYYRYLAEFNETQKTKDNAENAYKAALGLAEKLAPTHPTRLGLALNASVCHWEILKKPTKACELAKKAFDDAIQKLDSLSDSTYKDSTLIMQLLRDNLTIWTTENEDTGADGVAEKED